MLRTGERLSGYEITGLLGSGGMGEVYRARDLRLGRDVAIKVLPEALASDPEALARFEREARAVAALSHPGIMAIHGFGEDGGTRFAVMELLEGVTLREALRQGAVGVPKALEIAVQVARGLAAAHERGIVHRDLKPENLFLTRDALVKILDFGLARVSPDPSEMSSAPTVAGTTPGTVVGTVGYMSPEQVRGQAVDHRTDIFSFGCVLYELVAGRRAFLGETAAETMTAILREEPPDVSAPLPPALGKVIRHCLEKAPTARFQTARDLAFALETLPSSPPSAAATAPGAGRRSGPPRLALAALAALALGLAGLALWALRERPAASESRSISFHLPPPEGTEHTGMLAVSPDGKALAFVASGEDGHDRLYVRPLAVLQVRPLPGTEGAAFPFWSPDGRSLAFFAQGKLKTIDVAAGESVKTLCRARAARGGSWSPDGFLLFAPDGGAGIDLVPVGGGDPRRVLEPDPTRRESSLRWPALLPDGRRFLYLSLGPVETTGLYLGSVDSKETRRLTAADSSGLCVGPGELVYASGGRLVRQPFDLAAGRLAGAARPVADDVHWDAAASGYFAFSASPNGVLAHSSGGVATSRLLWYDRGGKLLGPLGPPGPYFEPALSPDEKSLAVARFNIARGHTEIWLVDLQRGSLTQLSPEPLAVTPVFSPDGQRVAYSTFPPGRVLVRRSSGAGEAELLFSHPRFCVLEQWTRGGDLLFGSLDLSVLRSEAWVKPADGARPSPLLRGGSSFSGARLSPDGRWLAYVSDESGIDEVFVQSHPDAAERFAVSSGGGQQPQWRADGREMFFVSHDRKVMSVPIATAPRFAPGTAGALFATHILPLTEARNQYVVTGDGQRFLVNSRRPEAASLPIVVSVETSRR